MISFQYFLISKIQNSDPKNVTKGRLAVNNAIPTTVIKKYTIRDIEITKKLFEWVLKMFDGWKHYLSGYSIGNKFQKSGA